MAYTLFDLAYQVAGELGALVESIATGGTLTTTLDSVRLQTIFEDDFFNLGTVFIVRDAAGLGAAPEKEFARVTDFTSSSGTVTHAALTVAPAAGDRFAVTTRRFDLDTIIRAINTALREILVETIDVSLSTAANQLEYTLPTALLNTSEIKVYIQRVTNDTDANEWQQVYDWYVEQAVAGTGKKLIFNNQPDYISVLRIHYFLPHAPLYTSTDKLHESVDINRVVLDAALGLLKIREQDTGHADPETKTLIARMEQRKSRMEWRQRTVRTGPKLATWGDIDG